MFWRLLFVIAFTLWAVFNIALIMTAIEKKITFTQATTMIVGQFLVFYVSFWVFSGRLLWL